MCNAHCAMQNIRLRKVLQLKEEEFINLKNITEYKQYMASGKNHSLLDKFDLSELEVETDKKFIGDSHKYFKDLILWSGDTRIKNFTNIEIKLDTLYYVKH